MKKYAVVTGASSGIGMEFAKLLVAKGYALVLVARRRERLETLAQSLDTECEIVTADLSQEEACYRVFDTIRDKSVEVFINNAGYGDCGAFVETDLQKETDMLHLNIRGLHILMKLIVQKFTDENQGYLLNVASSAGLLPAGPYMATYYATKAYVTSLTRAVAEELHRSKSRVYVGCLCPGPVDTEFNDVANVKFMLKGISAEYCARYGLQMMFRKKVVIVPTVTMKAAIVLGKLAPTRLAVKIAGNQQKRKLEV